MPIAYETPEYTCSMLLERFMQKNPAKWTGFSWISLSRRLWGLRDAALTSTLLTCQSGNKRKVQGRILCLEIFMSARKQSVTAHKYWTRKTDTRYQFIKKKKNRFKGAICKHWLFNRCNSTVILFTPSKLVITTLDLNVLFFLYNLQSELINNNMLILHQQFFVSITTDAPLCCASWIIPYLHNFIPFRNNYITLSNLSLWRCMHIRWINSPSGLDIIMCRHVFKI